MWREGGKGGEERGGGKEERWERRGRGREEENEGREKGEREGSVGMVALRQSLHRAQIQANCKNTRSGVTWDNQQLVAHL